jgi:uncharacterized protein YfaS (alpha-2-macroglobulin family)
MPVHPTETLEIHETIKDFDQETLIAPDSHSIKIYNPSGTLVTTITNPDEEEPGIYNAYYTLAADAPVGQWYYVWTATKNMYKGVHKKVFEVEEL